MQDFSNSHQHFLNAAAARAKDPPAGRVALLPHSSLNHQSLGGIGHHHHPGGDGVRRHGRAPPGVAAAPPGRRAAPAAVPGARARGRRRWPAAGPVRRRHGQRLLRVSHAAPGTGPPAALRRAVGTHPLTGGVPRDLSIRVVRERRRWVPERLKVVLSEYLGLEK
ncbi:uncharacterized protein LOC134537011 [Bacillus rossius redtenbacheri]|uniref:uncharacterized protein LOC134537011 n=1 Tax=Bacillus rossius redtenbacheri TaxID=93214 RepID=UPI002FDCB75A